MDCSHRTGAALCKVTQTTYVIVFFDAIELTSQCTNIDHQYNTSNVPAGCNYLRRCRQLGLCLQKELEKLTACRFFYLRTSCGYLKRMEASSLQHKQKPCLAPRTARRGIKSYHQQYNTLSALKEYTIGKIQLLWTLCVLQLKYTEKLLLFSGTLELDDDGDFLTLLLML